MTMSTSESWFTFNHARIFSEWLIHSIVSPYCQHSADRKQSFQWVGECGGWVWRWMLIMEGEAVLRMRSNASATEWLAVYRNNLQDVDTRVSHNYWIMHKYLASCSSALTVSLLNWQPSRHDAMWPKSRHPNAHCRCPRTWQYIYSSW